MIYVLGGGQSKGPVKKGTIVVTYPAGAICTVTNGSITYTALDTSGAAAFIVEPGTWTVQAIDGMDTLNEVVEITMNGQIKEVELTNEIGYIFESGVGAVVPLTTYKEDSQCYVNITTDTISKGWQSNNRVTSFSTENKIDLTDYYSLVIEYTCSDPGTGNYVEAFGISTVPAKGGVSTAILDTARRNLSSTSTKKTAILDLTKYTGEYYVGVCGAGKTVIYNMRLIKPRVLLFNDGIGNVGWTARSAKPTATIGETLYLYVNQDDQVSTITTTNKIDVSDYKTLHFYIDAKTGENNKRLIGLSNDTAPYTGAGSVNSSAVAYIVDSSVQTEDNRIDVSNITGSYYVCVTQAGSSSNPRSMTVSKVWLE